MNTSDKAALGHSFRARLRTAMEAKGLSARSLAIALETRGLQSVTRTTIGDYLSGQSCPTVSLAMNIADVVGVAPAWLLTGEGTMTSPAMPSPPPRIAQIAGTATSVFALDDAGCAWVLLDHGSSWAPLPALPVPRNPGGE